MVRQSSRTAATKAKEALQSSAPQKRKASGQSKQQPAKRGKEEGKERMKEEEKVEEGEDEDEKENKGGDEGEKEDKKEELRSPSPEKPSSLGVKEVKEEDKDQIQEQEQDHGSEREDGIEGEKEEPGTAKAEGEGGAEPEAGEDHGEKTADVGHAANVLEKGIIYFIFRGRMNVDEPTSVDDVARTFIVLRPIPAACHLEEGSGTGDDESKQQDNKPKALPKQGGEKCRQLILPKKTLPVTPRDRFVSWVEKAGTDIATIRASFKGEEHETKTRGLRHTPGATPFAEGVYAITSNGPQAGAGSQRTSGASHIAYMLTLPHEPTQVQTDFGVQRAGSFIVQVKNPSYKGPRFAPSKAPEYPPEILEEFHEYRWLPLQPKFIDYPNAQVLLIGEAQGFFGAGGQTDDPLKGEKGEDAATEIEGLEHANEIRVEPMKGQDAIFADLQMRKDEYPQVPSTWEEGEEEGEEEEEEEEEEEA